MRSTLSAPADRCLRFRSLTALFDLEFLEVLACFRRFWCPVCRHGCLVGHPGIVPRIRASLATVSAAVRAVAGGPVGEGLAEIAVQGRIQGSAPKVSASERARSGAPRWITLRRWVWDLERWWPALTLVGATWQARALAFTAAIGAGLPLAAFLEAAVHAHLRGGAVM